jgi:hypothetical protein
MPTLHAYYSPKQAEAGSAINVYRLADGAEVECSMVGSEPPAWGDVVDLGPLATEDFIHSWVRNVRPSEGMVYR